MNGMNADTLTKIQETAVAASKATVIPLPNEPGNIYGLVRPDGTYERVIGDPGPRTVMLRSIDQIIEYAKYSAGGFSEKSAVYFAESHVYLIQSDGKGSHRDGHASVKLNFTPEYLLALSLWDRVFDQKEYISLLRVDLADCHTPDIQKLIETSRSIETSSSSNSNSTVGHGQGSMGNNIEEQVRSRKGDIPEEVTIDLRVYDDRSLDVKRRVTCIVEVDARTSQFQLIPKPAELRDAIQKEMATLEATLSDCECPVYYGSPWGKVPTSRDRGPEPMSARGVCVD